MTGKCCCVHWSNKSARRMTLPLLTASPCWWPIWRNWAMWVFARHTLYISCSHLKMVDIGCGQWPRKCLIDEERVGMWSLPHHVQSQPNLKELEQWCYFFPRSFTPLDGGEPDGHDQFPGGTGEDAGDCSAASEEEFEEGGGAVLSTPGLQHLWSAGLHRLWAHRLCPGLWGSVRITNTNTRMHQHKHTHNATQTCAQF